MNRETVVLSLGSNLGRREENLLGAVLRLGGAAGIRIGLLSSLFETEPVGIRTSKPFINACCVIETTLEPRALLDVCKALERAAGRESGAVDRPLDIDVVLFGGLEIEEPDLVVPHPRFRYRRFVIEPLAEIAPDLELPPDGARAPALALSPACRGSVTRVSSRRIATGRSIGTI
jgi:2-amino-4-hydroxy-6-hydroxymethyldihydropteridine diphosphokinase